MGPGLPEPLRGRELAAEAITAAAFLAVAVALAVLLPAERPFDLPLAATLIATYAPWRASTSRSATASRFPPS